MKVGSVRPLVVKCHRYNEREMVRLKANELRDTLKAKNYTVKPQMPYDVLEKHKPVVLSLRG